MKHSLLSMILFAAVMAACGRDGTAGDGDVSGMTVSLTVGIDNASCTRAEEMKANAADEEKINSLQVVLFRNGEFYCAESSDSESVKITAEKGTYSIYAFVNDPIRQLAFFICNVRISAFIRSRRRNNFRDNTRKPLRIKGFH